MSFSGNLAGELNYNLTIMGDIDMRGYSIINATVKSDAKNSDIVTVEKVQQMIDDHKETGLPIGTLFHSYKNLLDQDRFLLCDGSSYDVIKYSKLFSILQSQFGNKLPNLIGCHLRYPQQDQQNNSFQDAQVGSHQHSYIDTSMSGNQYSVRRGAFAFFDYIQNIFNNDTTKQTIQDTNIQENRVQSFLSKIYIVGLNDSEQSIPTDSIVFNQIRNESQNYKITTFNDYILFDLDLLSFKFSQESGKINLELGVPFAIKQNSSQVEIDQNQIKYNNTTQLLLNENNRPSLEQKDYENIQTDSLISKRDLEFRLLSYNPQQQQDVIKYNNLDSNKLQIYNNSIALTLQGTQQLQIVPQQMTFNGTISLNQYRKATDNFQLIQLQQLNEAIAAIDNTSAGSSTIQEYVQQNNSNFTCGFTLSNYFQIKDGDYKKYIEIGKDNNYMYLRASNFQLSDMNGNQLITNQLGVTRIKNAFLQITNDANFVSCQLSNTKYISDGAAKPNYFRMPSFFGGELADTTTSGGISIRVNPVFGRTAYLDRLFNSIMEVNGGLYVKQIQCEQFISTEGSINVMKGRWLFQESEVLSAPDAAIYITTNRTYAIDAVQAIRSQGGFTSILTSNRSLKDNIQEFDNKHLMQLSPQTFIYKQDPQKKRKSGFIIEDILQIETMKQYIEEDRFINYTSINQDLLYQHHQVLKDISQRLQRIESLISLHIKDDQ